jgi:hypothetical protein
VTLVPPQPLAVLAGAPAHERPVKFEHGLAQFPFASHSPSPQQPE